MNKLVSRGLLLTIFLIIPTAFCCLPVQAETPSFDLVFEPETPESTEWMGYALGLPTGRTHINGNFSLTLINIEYVEFVLFRVGIDNTSATEMPNFNEWPLYFNDSSEPFQWIFNTMDFSIGEQKIWISATYTQGNGITTVGTSRTFFFEHQDLSSENEFNRLLAVALFITGLFSVVTVFLIGVSRKSR